MLPKRLHPSWRKFVTKDIINDLKKIEKRIGKNYNPVVKNNVLRFMEVDLNKVKVIWLGQDVYPEEGVATGRAFEVGTLNRWMEKFRQGSLKNIIRLIHKEYNGITDYKYIKKFSVIRNEIQNKQFNLKTPKDLFNSLEEQGVMFLNTSYTCEIGKRNSHKTIWHDFSINVIEYISEENPNIVWFLWGKEAISNKAHIKNCKFFESRHPSVCSEKYKDDFLKFDGFEKTKNIINWLG